MRQIPLGVPGLDRVLSEGRVGSGSTDNESSGEFVLPSEEKIFGVISGAAGAGKTLLALQMACKFLSSYAVFSDGEAPFAIYICTEERPETIRQRVIDNQFLSEEQIFIGWPRDVEDFRNSRQAKLIIVGIKPSFLPQAESISAAARWTGGIVDLLEQPGAALNALDSTVNEGFHERKMEDAEDQTSLWSQPTCLILDTLGLLACGVLWPVDEATGNGTRHYLPIRNRSDSQGNVANSNATLRLRWRQLMTLIKLLSQKDGFDFLCTVETNEDSQCLYEEAVFVANLALKISSDSGTQSSHNLRRTLEVEKARYQSVFRGPHDLTIIGPNTTESRFAGPLFHQKMSLPGMHVNPSLACQLAYYESLADRRPPSTARITTGIDKLDALVQRQLTNGGGFEPGTSIGIIAERGAGATSLSLQFLADGYPSEDCHILMISFAHSNAVLKTKIAGTSRTQDGLLMGTEFKPSFHVQGNVSPSLSPERFLVCLENFLEKYHPSRLVLDNLSILRTRYPAFTDIPLFSYALLRVCLSYGTTPLIIDTVPLVDEKGYITPEETQLQEIADNVLILAHVSLRGKPKWALMIRKSVNGVYNRGPFELTKKNHKGQMILDVVPESFEAYTDVFSGFAKYIPLRLSLYVDAEDFVQGSTLAEHPYTVPLEAMPSTINGEKRLESRGTLAKLTPLTRYKHQVASAFSASLPGISVNFWGPLEHGTYSSRPNSWGEVPRPDTVVMEFDGYWISELEEGECVLALQDALAYLGRKDALDKYMRGVKSDYRIPHYVDIGMLYKRIESESDADLNIRKIPSWKDIAERVNQSATLEEWRNSAIFDFDRTTSEMFSVLFLEFAIAAVRESTIKPSEQSSIGVLGIDQARFRHGETKDKNYELYLYPTGDDNDKKAYRKAIVLACTTFLSLFPFNRRIRRYVTTTKRCNVNAVYQRHWYSTFGAQLARAETRRKRTSSYMVYDGLPLFTEATDAGSSPVVGSWHLGVAKGSASPSLGVRAILEMTTPESDLNKFVNHVGLPAGSWFYKNSTPNCFPPPVAISPSPQAIQKSYLNNGFSRAWIKNYRDISFVLQLFMRELLLKPAVHEEVEKCCIKYQRMIDAIYSA